MHFPALKKFSLFFVSVQKCVFRSRNAFYATLRKTQARWHVRMRMRFSEKKRKQLCRAHRSGARNFPRGRSPVKTSLSDTAGALVASDAQLLKKYGLAVLALPF